MVCFFCFFLAAFMSSSGGGRVCCCVYESRVDITLDTISDGVDTLAMNLCSTMLQRVLLTISWFSSFLEEEDIMTATKAWSKLRLQIVTAALPLLLFLFAAIC